LLYFLPFYGQFYSRFYFFERSNPFFVYLQLSGYHQIISEFKNCGTFIISNTSCRQSEKLHEPTVVTEQGQQLPVGFPPPGRLFLLSFAILQFSGKLHLFGFHWQICLPVHRFSDKSGAWLNIAGKIANLTCFTNFLFPVLAGSGVPRIGGDRIYFV
jgi:hypothetical protein